MNWKDGNQEMLVLRWMMQMVLSSNSEFVWSGIPSWRHCARAEYMECPCRPHHQGEDQDQCPQIMEEWLC